jgi:drug/metabolite transporter (DMT)-like permease
MTRVWFGLFVGVAACSTSVIFIKATTMAPAYLAATRLLFAAVLLLPLFLKHFYRATPATRRQVILGAIPGGILLALHFISWNEGARRTLAAHATMIVNMVPLALPFLLWLTHKERVNRREWLATTLALAGVGWLAFRDFHFAPEHFVGDLICFGSMIVFAAYLAFGRRNREAASIWLYMVPLYAVAGVFCLMVALWDWQSIVHAGYEDYLAALALALIPTLTGHTLLNWSMRRLRGQVVGVVNVSQFVFSGFMAYWVYSELPGLDFFVVGVLVGIACVLVVLTPPCCDRN